MAVQQVPLPRWDCHPTGAGCTAQCPGVAQSQQAHCWAGVRSLSPSSQLSMMGLQEEVHVVDVPPRVIHEAPGLRIWHRALVVHRLPKVLPPLAACHMCDRQGGHAERAGCTRRLRAHAAATRACLAGGSLPCFHRRPGLQAAAYFALAAPALQLSAQQAALAHLLLKLLEDALCEDAYLADLAGLSYQVQARWPSTLPRHTTAMAWHGGLGCTPCAAAARQAVPHHLPAPTGWRGQVYSETLSFEAKVDGFAHRLPVLAGRVLQALHDLQACPDLAAARMLRSWMLGVVPASCASQSAAGAVCRACRPLHHGDRSPW